MNILFLCEHGGAKSVMAASYFNRLAQQHELPYVAAAAATEEPYAEVLPPVAELLSGEGIDVRTFRPRRVDPDDVRQASRIIAIDCSLAGAERWDDVPKVSEDLQGSVAAIRRHVDALVKELRGRT